MQKSKFQKKISFILVAKSQIGYTHAWVVVFPLKKVKKVFFLKNPKKGFFTINKINLEKKAHSRKKCIFLGGKVPNRVNMVHISVGVRMVKVSYQSFALVSLTCLFFGSFFSLFCFQFVEEAAASSSLTILAIIMHPTNNTFFCFKKRIENPNKNASRFIFNSFNGTKTGRSQNGEKYLKQ